MIVPSIDLASGSAVQLVGGETQALDAGDPRPIARRFGRIGEIAVIDLDAALGRGSNAGTIRDLLPIARCRVGGGIRDAQTAIEWLDAGARSVILGTAATPGVLRELPKDRVIAALDARHGEVVVEGWTKSTGERIEDRIDALKPYVGGFLITFVEREGRMGGLPIDRVRELVERAAPARVTVAGGARTPSDIADADRAGADVQVGMALYTGAFDLADGFCAPLTSDRPDGLWPTVVVNEHLQSLGLVYSNLDSVRASLEHQRGVYYSRSRNTLWPKGETSGDVQELLRIDADCDRDALRFVVKQHGNGFCHLDQHTCFGDLTGIPALARTLAQRCESAPDGSYTKRLFTDADLLRSKLLEEANELLDANTARDASWEAADTIYFALVAAIARGASLADIESQLDARAWKVTRRPGDAKTGAPHDD
ncbi:MAG: phosphoribosyl-ATP diphosphatase [Planctomycetota bacterium]